jgi:hypothetical protein
MFASFFLTYMREEGRKFSRGGKLAFEARAEDFLHGFDG